MNLYTLTPTTTNIQDFINFWSKQYAYTSEETYYNAISKKEFTATDIQNLYVWKNGMKLSAPKQKSVDTKIKAKLTIINRFKSNNEIDLDAFKKEFKNIPAVWKIFLLHSIKPNKYPIYDQHIHRAYNYIHNLGYRNISSDMSNKLKEEFYFKTYLPFIKEQKFKDLKKLDEALFAFGQFLNTRNYATILQ